MKLRIILLSILLGTCLQNSFGQKTEKFIKATVASDTILHGNAFEFKIIIRNLKGDFTPPNFTDFDIVGGPNLSTNMQYTNGQMFKETSYSYFLRARNVGEYFIEESFLIVDGEEIQTEAIQVFVQDNPEEIKHNYRIDQDSKYSLFFPPEYQQKEKEKKKKPKKPLKKI